MPRRLRLEKEDQITQEQKTTLSREIERFCTLSKLVDLHQIDYTSLEDVIDSLTFEKFTNNVNIHCPLLSSMLHVFVSAEEERKKKTTAEKLLRVVHGHGLLIKIGSERGSKFPLFLAILLVSFGCGEGRNISLHYAINVEIYISQNTEQNILKSILLYCIIFFVICV